MPTPNAHITLQGREGGVNDTQARDFEMEVLSWIIKMPQSNHGGSTGRPSPSSWLESFDQGRMIRDEISSNTDGGGRESWRRDGSEQLEKKDCGLSLAASVPV